MDDMGTTGFLAASQSQIVLSTSFTKKSHLASDGQQSRTTLHQCRLHKNRLSRQESFVSEWVWSRMNTKGLAFTRYRSSGYEIAFIYGYRLNATRGTQHEHYEPTESSRKVQLDVL